jgi:hypothetical protein
MFQNVVIPGPHETISASGAVKQNDSMAILVLQLDNAGCVRISNPHQSSNCSVVPNPNCCGSGEDPSLLLSSENMRVHIQGEYRIDFHSI